MSGRSLRGPCELNRDTNTQQIARLVSITASAVPLSLCAIQSVTISPPARVRRRSLTGNPTENFMQPTQQQLEAFWSLKGQIVEALFGADGALDAVSTQLNQCKKIASPDDTGPDEALEEANDASAATQGVLRQIREVSPLLSS